jgi:hypothetical protein
VSVHIAFEMVLLPIPAMPNKPITQHPQVFHRVPLSHPIFDLLPVKST